MNRKNVRQQEGITLIALVITIIVMLILVAVTITVAVNGGLFDYAKNAAVDTNTAMREEQDLASLESGLSTEDLIAKYTGAWHSTADGKLTNGKYTVEIGDYINYNCHNGTDYSESGFAVTSSSNTSVKWQVLGAENGNLLIVSKDSLGDLELSGADGYNNGVSRLNTICAIYGHGENAVGARSIKIEDVNKLTGYDPEHDSINNTGENAGKPYGYGEIWQYGNKATYTLTSKGVDYSGTNGKTGTLHNSSVKLMKLGETTNTSPLTVESTFYSYENSIVSSDATKFDLLFGDGTRKGGKLYWLASSYVYAYGGYVYWGMRLVRPHELDFSILWYSDVGANSQPCGVRAVVSLASDIKLKPATAANTWDFDLAAE